MAKGQKPDYEAFVSEKSEGQEKARYTKIGVAWNVANGGISIRLDGLPVGGQMVLFPRDRDEDER